MSLAPGSRLGAYEVIASSERTAWGEVYRARDTRLDRIVAPGKILPEALASDVQFGDRFSREARAELFSGRHLFAVQARKYDVSRDGKRF